MLPPDHDVSALVGMYLKVVHAILLAKMIAGHGPGDMPVAGTVGGNSSVMMSRYLHR